ncbi:Est-6 [Trypoxylus dichotomus]
MLKLLVLFGITLIAIVVFVNGDEDRPLVSIEDGQIRGTFKKSFNGRKYMSFEGIPYAQPPLQKLRFKEPEPVEPWPGVLDATMTYTCLQLGQEGVIGQEDCLYLNVYVPRERINPEEKLDVIVHIHGGAFMLGSPTMLAGPLYFMDRDVVYVNFNYRLGPFGFFSVSDIVFHGNYGLKDQVMVLEWVKRNIEKFGGNKDSVTLIGLSAGAASVHLHYFSQMSKGLFHRGFSHSGVALNPWVMKQDPWPNAKVIISEIGCYNDNIKDNMVPLVPFGPTTETYMPTAFLNAMPYLHLGSKQVHDIPFLISVTTEEGTLPAAMYYDRIDELNANWTQLLPFLLEYYQYEDEEKDRISQEIKEFYFKGEDVTKENFATFVKICSHRLFHIGAEKVAKLQANATEAPVYFLLMGYGGENLQINITSPFFNPKLGVGHGADGRFYYDIAMPGLKNLENEREIKMKDILVDMVVSFAKTGKPEVPNVDFQPVAKSGNLKYLSIKAPDDISMKSTKRLGPHEFWKSLNLREDENVIIIKDNLIEIK